MWSYFTLLITGDFRGPSCLGFPWKEASGAVNVIAEETQSQSLADCFDKLVAVYPWSLRAAGVTTRCWGHIRDAEPLTFGNEIHFCFLEGHATTRSPHYLDRGDFRVGTTLLLEENIRMIGKYLGESMALIWIDRDVEIPLEIQANSCTLSILTPQRPGYSNTPLLYRFKPFHWRVQWSYGVDFTTFFKHSCHGSSDYPMVFLDARALGTNKQPRQNTLQYHLKSFRRPWCQIPKNGTYVSWHVITGLGNSGGVFLVVSSRGCFFEPVRRFWMLRMWVFCSWWLVADLTWRHL